MMESARNCKRKRCLNIDWLELYCFEPSEFDKRDAAYYEKNGYIVQRRDYGTRVYAEMFTILDSEGHPFLEVRRAPLSDTTKDGGLFPPYACHVRLTNFYCYVHDPIAVLRQFLAMHGYDVVKIFRLDVCLDFEYFDYGDDPAKFIQRYISGKYSKVNQANIAAHGTDTWERRVWNSFSWGAKGSMVSTKFYCKSIELAHVHDKPYIRYSWYRAGLIDDYVNNTKVGQDGKPYTPVIWRVEFSIHASAKRWFLVEDACSRKKRDIYMEHTLSMYDTPIKLATLFASLAKLYFRFKVFEDGVRKDRCKDKRLFDFSYLDEFIKPDRQLQARPCSTLIMRLKRALNAYRCSMLDSATLQAVDTILSKLEEEEVSNMVGSEFSDEDILLLQRLIAERTGSKQKTDLQAHKETLSAIINGTHGQIW